MTFISVGDPVKRAAAWHYVFGMTANLPLQQDTILHAVIYSLTLLKMGKNCPKHVDVTLEINK
jgi:hypothetical protein